jgi:hypothetical protein
MEFQLSSQGREMLKYGNEMYYEHRRGKHLPIITWRCRRHSLGCKAMLKTLEEKLIGNTTPLHLHGGFDRELTSSKNVRDKNLERLLHLIKIKSPKINELSRKLNQTGLPYNQKVHASMSQIKPDNTSNELSNEEAEEDDDNDDEENHTRSINKGPTKPLKWSKRSKY